MLIRFSVKNFRSIGLKPITLDMVSSSKIRTHPEHVCVSLKGAKVLRNAVVYGGNAAGKSNLIKALVFMGLCVLNGSLPRDCAREYCRAGNDLSEEETVFDVQFGIDGTVYDYGFSCSLKHLAVTSEWLYELGRSPNLLFQRSASENIELGSALEKAGNESDLTRFRIYSEDFSTLAKEQAGLLLLTALGRGKSFTPESKFASFQSVLSWFSDHVRTMGSSQLSPTFEFYADEANLSVVAKILASFDTGVSGLKKQVMTIAELERRIDPVLALTIRNMLAQNPPIDEETAFAITLRNESMFIGIERRGTKDATATVLEISHRSSSSTFEFAEESDGTKRLFDFMDMLFSKWNDVLFVVDEIDRSLHPMLTQHLVALFNKVHADDSCQLLCTTHENEIMSYDYFRRDEIWFMDRNLEGQSRLYPLDRFTDIRSDSRLAKQYLEGRYGGIPVLLDIEALFNSMEDDV